nr:MAG TPA: Neugrin [Caudoviricetes sp.]
MRAEINGGSKLTVDEVKEIYIRAKNGESNITLGEEFGVNPDQIGRIKNKKS